MSRRSDVENPPPAPNPKRSDSQAIVESIIAAALELASPDVTMNEIAERAGVGIASLYRYFPNRTAIYAEISRRLLRKFQSQLQVILADSDQDLQAAVTEVCRAVVVGPEVSPEVRRSLNLLVPFSWSAQSADDVFRTALLGITAWLEHKLEEPPADLAQRVFVAFASARGAMNMSTIYPDLAPSHEALIRHMARGVMAHLDAKNLR